MQLLKRVVVERRKKTRFPMTRDLRYKVLEREAVVGSGTTLDMGSGGVAFESVHQLPPGAFIELSVSWPVLLGDACPMRLIAFGRVLRSSGHKTACSIDKYEFRTQARTPVLVTPVRNDSMLQRWAGNIRKEGVKTAAGQFAS
jgi:hypothetical protein